MLKDLDMKRLNTGLILINGFLTDMILYLATKYDYELDEEEKKVVEACRLLAKNIGGKWNEYIK